MNLSRIVNEDMLACPEKPPSTIKKKCHGNRKLQHFKRKWRARGLTEEQIQNLLDTKHHTVSEQLIDGQAANDRPKQLSKRKRDASKPNLMHNATQSLSQLTISQGERASKKRKSSTDKSALSGNNDDNHSHSNNDHRLYKSSKYLRMPRKLLLHSLRLQLARSLKRKSEQRFVLARLRLFDEQFCLDEIRRLYQTYFDHGARCQAWPVSIFSTLSRRLLLFRMISQGRCSQDRTI